MRILTLVFLIAVTTFSSLVSAKALKTKEKVDEVSTHFMSQIAAGDIEEAYSLISAYLGVNMEKFLDRGKKAHNEIVQINYSAGKPLSFALLDKQEVGDHFYKVKYLLKYESAALIWELNYYQPKSGWKLVDVSYNADIEKLFK